MIKGACVMNRKQEKAYRTEYRRRMRELNDIRSSLHNAYSAFDSVTDPDMTDACIFEISALKSRYNYAVARIKNMSLQGDEHG